MSKPVPLIVGAGVAGLWAAWRLAAEGREALLLTKGTLSDSATAWAQGGIAVAIGPGDSPAQHAMDTLAAGDGLSDPEAVEILVTEGPERIRELLALGAAFDRADDGRLRFGLEAAHTRARILHADGDRTGAMLVRCLTAVVRHLPRSGCSSMRKYDAWCARATGSWARSCSMVPDVRTAFPRRRWCSPPAASASSSP
jgi:L-aspartate oxidase